MVVSYPLPDRNWDLVAQTFTLVLYLSTIGWAVAALWYPKRVAVAAFLSLFSALFVWWRAEVFLPLFVLGVFSIWLWVRHRRLQLGKKLVIALSLLVLPAVSAAQTPAPKVIPKELSGLLLNEFSSCIVMDQIPWRFRPDGRKTRLLISDRLRVNTEVKFSQWQIHQVMDVNGFVSYIFRRPLASGRFESFITKNLIYNRVVDTPRGRRTVEVQELRNLVNRPVLSFFHEDGGSITYSPSSIGNALLTLQQSSGTGRILPPIFLRGNYCDRPDSQEDIDRVRQSEIKQQEKDAGAAGAGASAAGGAGAK